MSKHRKTKTTRKTSNCTKTSTRNSNRSYKYPDNDEQLYKGTNAKYADDKAYGKRSGGNDVSWYKGNGSLTSATAAIPFNLPTGMKFNRFTRIAGYDTIKFGGSGYTNPGICTLSLAPSIGNSSDSGSPINIAATAMYSYIRHANSGTAYGDPADTMIFMLAMSQVYSYINWLQRLYGCASLYAQQNRYIPRGLVQAQGVDFDSITSNFADFRYGINLLIAKAAAFAVPNVFPYFQRQAFLYSNVYTEGNSIRDQLYMFIPAGFWFYTEGTTASPLSKLTYRSISHSSLWKYDELLSIGNEMMQYLLSSEDIGILSGNILKAFGDSNIIKLSPLPEQYNLTPVYDIGVLEQFKNATPLQFYNRNTPNSAIVAFSNDVTQLTTINSAGVYSVPTVTLRINGGGSVVGVGNTPEALRAMLYGDAILSTEQSDPTEDTIIENTRLMITAEPDQEGLWSYVGTATPVYTQWQGQLHPASEIPIQCQVWVPDFTATGDPYANLYPTVIPSLLVTGDYAMQSDEYAKGDVYVATRAVNGHLFAEIAALRSAFKYLPRTELWSMRNESTDAQLSVPLYYEGCQFEISNFAIMSKEELAKLNNACLMNMFYVPSVGSL